MEQPLETPPPGYTVAVITPTPQQQQHNNFVVNLPPGQTAPVPWVVILQPSVSSDYQQNPSIRLGNAMIVAGSLSIIFNAIAFGIVKSYLCGFCIVGHGFWGGSMCVIAGVFGIIAGKTKSICKIRACMVLSIIAACLCLGQFLTAIMGSYFYWWNGFVVIEILLAIMAFVGGIAALPMSINGCRAACCRCCCNQTQYGMMPSGVPVQMTTQPNGQFEPMPHPGTYVYSMQQPNASAGCYDAPCVFVPLPGAATGYRPQNCRPLKPTNYVAPPPDDDDDDDY